MTDTQPLAYPGIYPKDSEIIPYSPRREFKFMPSDGMTDPGIYPKDSEIIPYSPRREFKFMPSGDNTIKIDEMRDMSTDQIVELYKQGFRLEDMAPVSTSTIETASNGITVSSDVLLIVGIGVLAYLFITR